MPKTSIAAFPHVLPPSFIRPKVAISNLCQQPRDVYFDLLKLRTNKTVKFEKHL